MAKAAGPITVDYPRAGTEVLVDVQPNQTFSLGVVGRAPGIEMVGGALLWRQGWEQITWTSTWFEKIDASRWTLAFENVPFRRPKKRTLVVFQRGCLPNPQAVALTIFLRKRPSVSAAIAKRADEVHIDYPLAQHNPICPSFIAAGTRPLTVPHIDIEAWMNHPDGNVQGTPLGAPGGRWFVDFTVPERNGYTLWVKIGDYDPVESTGLTVQQHPEC